MYKCSCHYLRFIQHRLITVTTELYSEINPTYGVSSSDSVVINRKAIEASLSNIFSTKIGERWFLPEFGSEHHLRLFDNIGEQTSFLILNDLIRAVETWEPRVIVNRERSSVNPDEDNLRYVISLVCTLVSDNSEIIYETTFEVPS